MTPRSVLALTAAAALLSCPWPAPARAAVVVPSQFVDDVIVGGLDQPTSFAFLPGGRVLFTEQRSGKVRMIVGGHIAATDPVLQLGDVNTSGYERGLQGVTVDPAWPGRPYVYLYYNRLGGTIRLVRYTAGDNVADSTTENLWLYSPRVLIDDIPDGNPDHNAGGLRWGSGNKLFVSLGDDEVPCSAADSGSFRGAILRLDVNSIPPDSGSQVPRSSLIPAGNPFPTAPSLNGRLAWAYGMRNPWRFDADSLTGTLYVGDVGEADFEEVDEVYAGDFLGWPYREGFKVMSPIGCTEPGGTGANNYKGPILAMPHGAGATALCCAGAYRPSPSGSSNWPAQYWGYYGDLFYAEYFTGVLRRLKRQAGQWGTPPPVPGQPDSQNWATGLFGAVDFHVGRDGSLWWLSQFDATFTGVTGSLQRIRYLPIQAAAEPAASANAALRPAPNPFTDDTRLSFRLESAAPVRLEVFDLAGRRVRTLMRGVAAAGETHVNWFGDDNAGRPVPPGVYVARLVRGESSTVVRVLRVK